MCIDCGCGKLDAKPAKPNTGKPTGTAHGSYNGVGGSPMPKGSYPKPKGK